MEVLSSEDKLVRSCFVLFFAECNFVFSASKSTEKCPNLNVWEVSAVVRKGAYAKTRRIMGHCGDQI